MGQNNWMHMVTLEDQMVARTQDKNENFKEKDKNRLFTFAWEVVNPYQWIHSLPLDIQANMYRSKNQFDHRKYRHYGMGYCCTHYHLKISNTSSGTLA